jgi:hypothetical protein
MSVVHKLMGIGGTQEAMSAKKRMSSCIVLSSFPKNLGRGILCFSARQGRTVRLS